MVAILQFVVQPGATTPFVLLAIVSSILVAHICSIGYTHAIPHATGLSTVIEVIVTFAIVLVILQMPMRDPHLPKDQIGSSYERPTYELRSPEDNLTLWQFMTVSWMSPLISLGASRKLNEEDVWFLGFEFQHTYLHNAFRDLKGAVTWRLLKANGLDLVIITVLAILESFASKSR